MAKPIRFKVDYVCDYWEKTSQGGYECAAYTNVDVPMNDWKFTPEHINTTYTQGEIPPNDTIDIQFPELDLWNARNYENVYFEISALYQGEVADWLDFKSDKLNQNEFYEANIRSDKVQWTLKNLSHIPVGTHTATIVVKAYEVKNGQKTLIETCPEPVRFILNVKAGKIIQNPEFIERKLFYNLDTQELTGDTTIEIPYDSSYDRIMVSLVGFNTNTTLSRQGDKSIITFNHPDNAIIKQNYNAGVYSGRIELREKAFLGSYISGVIPLLVTIRNNKVTSDFSVAPTEFDLSVSKTTNEIKTATANLYNPQNLNISVKLAPSFLTNVRIENGELKFQTKTLTDMPLGKYSGEIILVSDSLEKRVLVKLNVMQTLVSDFHGADYYFALDRNKVIMNRVKPEASYTSLILELYYKGFGRELTERQEYTQHYFDNQIELFPGEEIQDFFIRCSSLASDNLSKIYDYQYSFAIANIIIKEFDANDVELGESRLNNVFFLPGRKPKCFPFLTDFAKRRVFEHSKIRLNTDIFSEKPALSELFEKYDEPLPTLEKKHEVFAFNFEKNRFPNIGKKLIKTGNLEFIPFPEPKGGKLIHLFFENQNLVLEWFSCPADYQRKFDFNHITDELTGEKFGALETENWILNTGWILREEIELINALLKSRICFIVIGNQIIKARPMGKKNEMYNTAENLYSMDLEFNIKQNER